MMRTPSVAVLARLIGCLLMLATLAVKAQVVDRRPGEMADDFARRVGPPGATLAHPVLETDEWHLGTKVVIAFYAVNSNGKVSSQEPDVVDGIAFMPTAEVGRYRRVAIGRIDQEGAPPDIKSIFFANADHNAGRELVVIVGWEQRHRDVYGTLYGTYIYARPIAPSQDSFVFLEDTSRKVSGGCECDRTDEEHEISGFKTAADVRAGLRELGFR